MKVGEKCLRVFVRMLWMIWGRGKEADRRRARRGR